MTLKTGCVEWERRPEDGYRICVMSRTTDDTGRIPVIEHAQAKTLDCWLPLLAPPSEAVRDYYRGKKELSQLFNIYRDYLTGIIPRREMRIVTDRALEQDVTILCVETYAKICHRSVLLEACLAEVPNLTIVQPSEAEEKARPKIKIHFAYSNELPRRSSAKQERPELE
jgi:uncharacterized protein YeaO (DUF488 family)